jgi:hypothetical protein
LAAGEGALDAGEELRGRVDEGDADAEGGDGVDNFAVGLEGAGIVRDAENDVCAYRKRVNHVEIAAGEAKVADAGFEARGAALIGEFGVRDVSIPGGGTAVGVHGGLWRRATSLS